MLDENSIDFDAFLNDVESGASQYSKQNTIQNEASPAELQSTIENEFVEEPKAEAGAIEFDTSEADTSDDTNTQIQQNESPIEKSAAAAGNFLGNVADVNVGVDDVEPSENEYDIDMESFLSQIEEAEKAENPKARGMADLNDVLEKLPQSLAYDVQMKLEKKFDKMRASAKRDGIAFLPKDIGEYYNTLSEKEKNKLVDPTYLKKGDAVASKLINAKTADSLDEMAEKYGSDWVIQNLYKQNEKEFGKRTKETAADLLREIYRARRQKLPWRSKNPYLDIMKDPNFEIAPESMKKEIQQKADDWKESVRPANLIKQMLNGDFHLPNTQSYKRVNFNNLNFAYLEGEIPQNDLKVNRLIGEMKNYASKRDDPASCLNDEQKEWIQYSSLFHNKDIDFNTWRAISKGDWNERSKEWAQSQFENDLKNADSDVWDSLSDEEKRQAFEEYAQSIEGAFSKLAEWRPLSKKDIDLGGWDLDEETADDEAEMAAIANGDSELADSIHKYGRNGAGEKFLPDLYKAIRPIDTDLETTKNEIAPSKRDLSIVDEPIDVEYTIRDDEEKDEGFDWHQFIDWDDHKFVLLPLLFKEYATPKSNFRYEDEGVKTIEGEDNTFELSENGKRAAVGSTSKNSPNVSTHSAGGSLSAPNTKKSGSSASSSNPTNRAVSATLPNQRVSAPQIAKHSNGTIQSNGAVSSGPAFGKGGSLNASHAKLAGGFANNQSLLSKLNTKLGSAESSNMLASVLESKILADSNTWSGDNSGDKYEPYVFIKMANNKIEVQNGRKRTLLTSLDNQQLKQISDVFEANQTKSDSEVEK